MIYPRVEIQNRNGTNLFNELGKIDTLFAILNQIIININPNSMTFNTASSKGRIAEYLNISIPTVHDNIKKLEKSRVLIRVGRSEYVLNKELIHLDYKKLNNA